MAFSKIVGLEVTPLMPSSAIRRASLPESSSSRLMLSSQIDWPSARMASSGLPMRWLPGRGSPASYPPWRSRSLLRVSDIAGRRSEYESTGLERSDLDPDPLRQWQRWYDEAVAAGVTEPNAMALSTLGEDGAPDVRFVLVRGVDERGLAFYTNLTSVKARQLDAHPSAAAAFGWLQLHRQVRVRGQRRARLGRRGRRLLRLAPARVADRRVGLAAEPADRRPRRARRARAPGGRAPSGRGRAPARALGRLPHRPERDRVLAGPAEPAPRSPALPPLGRGLGDRAPRALTVGARAHRGRAPRMRRPAPAGRPARPCRG